MKKFDLKEILEDDLSDIEIFLPNGTPFTQAPFYGVWQKSLGRLVKKFQVCDGENVVAYYQIIRFPLYFKWNYFYIPYGPIIIRESADLLIFIKKHLKQLAKDNQAVFVRLDFTPIINSPDYLKIFRSSPKYTYHSAYFQPRYEWALTLTPTEDELLQGADKDTRYSIKLAAKREITTEIVTKDFQLYFEKFYELMSETAKRNDFSLHPKKYYAGVFSNLTQTKDSYLSIARYKNKILAINVMLVFKDVANYVYAASSTEERNRAPAYLAQWTGILHAKNIGCKLYNFGGITDNRDQHQNWEGLTFFKKNFGGYTIDHSDFFDLIINPIWYYLYCLRKLFQKIRNGV